MVGSPRFHTAKSSPRRRSSCLPLARKLASCAAAKTLTPGRHLGIVRLTFVEKVDISIENSHHESHPSRVRNERSKSSASPTNACAYDHARPLPPPTHQCVLAPSPASHSPVLALSRPEYPGAYWLVRSALNEITPPRRTARLALAMRPAMACAVLRGAGRAAQGHDRRPAGNAARCRLCAHPGGGQRERPTPELAVRAAAIARRAPVAQRPAASARTHRGAYFLLLSPML